MPEIFTYGFMQRAFVAGLIVAVICPATGIFLVLRRLSMIGDTLSHVALAGVAAGMIGGIYPIYSALIFSVLAALGVEKLRKEYHEYAELSLAIILSTGIGLATILISIGGSNSAIFSYLFGSITLVSKQDLYMMILIGIIILISILLLYRALFYASFDEQAAVLAGIPLKWIHFYFTVLTAMTIAISMRIVGILLVSSLMVLPVATSLQVAKSFRGAFGYSIFFGLLSVLVGLFISFYGSLAPGGTIVIAAVGFLIITLAVKKIKARMFFKFSGKTSQSHQLGEN